MPGLSELYEDQLDAIEWGKKEAQRLETAKVTVEDVEQAVWKIVEEKIATGEFHPKKEE